MANEAMDVMFNMLNHMPKGKGKRADEQYGDQPFNERGSEVEIHYIGSSRTNIFCYKWR